MRVLFDGFWWVDGPGANKTVMREFILEWVRQFPGDELLLAVRSGHSELADAPPGVKIVTTRLWPHALSNILELSVIARRHHVDATLTHNYTPAFGRSVVFVHDLMFMEHPEWFSVSERIYFAPMAWTGRRATAVTTSSETEALRMTRVAPYLDPVQPVGLAVATELTEASGLKPDCAPATVFSLVVGRLNVRKNLANVLTAAGQAASISPAQPLLVVGDAAHSGKSLELDGEVAALVAGGSVVFLGRVSDAELHWLYSHAGVTICASMDEGFGLPPLEAASLGSPLVVSDIAVFRETVGDIAVLVDPTNPADIAQGIDQAFDPRRRNQDQSREAAARYSWPKSVAALREVMDEAIRR